jgi:hypothetical protein
MRIAAGILMVIFGMTTMGMIVDVLIEYGTHAYDLPFNLFIVISAVFITTGGVFCLKRKYWKLCFTSSLFLLLFMILFFFSLPPPITWVALFLIPGGILPIIFVCIRKREWQEIQA